MNNLYTIFHADKARTIAGKRALVEVKRYRQKSRVGRWQALHPHADVWVKETTPDGNVEWLHEEGGVSVLADENGLEYNVPYTYLCAYTPSQIDLLFVVLDSFQ